MFFLCGSFFRRKLGLVVISFRRTFKDSRNNCFFFADRFFRRKHGLFVISLRRTFKDSRNNCFLVADRFVLGENLYFSSFLCFGRLSTVVINVFASAIAFLSENLSFCHFVALQVFHLCTQMKSVSAENFFLF